MTRTQFPIILTLCSSTKPPRQYAKGAFLRLLRRAFSL